MIWNFAVQWPVMSLTSSNKQKKKKYINCIHQKFKFLSKHKFSYYYYFCLCNLVNKKIYFLITTNNTWKIFGFVRRSMGYLWSNMVKCLEKYEKSLFICKMKFVNHLKKSNELKKEMTSLALLDYGTNINLNCVGISDTVILYYHFTLI